MTRSAAHLSRAAMIIAVSGVPLLAQLGFAPNSGATATITPVLKAKAKADECYKGLGLNPPPVPKPPCVAPAIPKINHAYVWALSGFNNDVWFGTAANPLCWTYSGSLADPNSATPHQTASWACEFGLSPYSGQYGGPLPPAYGDFRPPFIYVYNKATGTLLNVTPFIPNTNPPVPMTQRTRGIRAAAMMYDSAGKPVMIVGGPDLDPKVGLNFFAYDATTKAFLGMKTIPGYGNIRDFVGVNGIWYTTVGKTAGGGAVIRWKPTIAPPPCASCFNFEVVGNIDTVGAYLAAHAGRVYITTWPSETVLGSQSSLWMSPPLPSGGFTAAHQNSWTRVWKASDYEPDPVIVLTYAGGALGSFDGWLYWGTQHEPWLGYAAFSKAYGPPVTQEEKRAAAVGTQRAISIFRGRNLDTATPTIELLYGGAKLPTFVPAANSVPGQWVLKENNMHQFPLYGPSGFGNFFNNYTWAMKVWNNRLWVGTMDWAMLSKDGADLVAKILGIELPPNLFGRQTFGADLYYFPSSTLPAYPENTAGIGNYTSYGVRNMLSLGNLFFGMANNMNLLGNPADAIPEGGWELIEATAAAANTAVGANRTVSLPGGVTVTYCNITRAGKTVSSTIPNPWLDPSLNQAHPLLADFDFTGPETPAGFATPANVTLLWSTAVWTSCSSPALAAVGMPVPAGMANPRLFEMQWNGSEFFWVDVTTSVANGRINGNMSARGLGVLAVLNKL